MILIWALSMCRIGATVIGKGSNNRCTFTHQPRAGGGEVGVGVSLDPCSFPQQLLCTQSVHFKLRGNGKTVGSEDWHPGREASSSSDFLSVFKGHYATASNPQCFQHLWGLGPTPQRQKRSHSLRCTMCLNGKKTKGDWWSALYKQSH